MATRSKTVSAAIKKGWARLAFVAFKKAIARIEIANDLDGAEVIMETVEDWLDRAGADATKWNFHG